MARNRINVRWQRPPQEIQRNIARYAGQIRGGLLALAQEIAEDAEAEMESDAPWTNRTGDARRELFSTAVQVNQELIRLYLSHGPDIFYGVFLELKNAGRFAIVGPTWEKYLSIVERRVKQKMR